MNLNQITVPSLDLTKSIPFYKELGLNLIIKALHEGERAANAVDTINGDPNNPPVLP